MILKHGREIGESFGLPCDAGSETVDVFWRLTAIAKPEMSC
jgi:hypothetical protein